MSEPSRDRLAGVFPIISSPFAVDGGLDETALARLAGFIADGGAHGAVYPAIASEFATLTAAERRSGVATAARALKDRIPLVVGISDETPELSAAHARQAQEIGAAAVMLMAPRSAGDSADSVTAFFRNALGDARLPVIMQNAPPPLGSSLSIETVREVCRRIPAIRYVKEEVVPCGQRITALLEGVPDLDGVFGGAGGRFVLDELARGAAGSMPACEVTELHVGLYEAFRAGRMDEARRIFNALLPLLNLGSAYRTPITKHVLGRRGVLSATRHRDNNPVLDRFDIAELDTVWSALEQQLA